MKCEECSSANPKDARFCASCGALLPPRCTRCGTVNPSGLRFCEKCGTALAIRHIHVSRDAALIARPPAQQHEDISGERKMVTSVFADITGSMEMIERLDPDDARRLVDPALYLMIEAAHRYGGYVVQSTGDGIFALFGAPVAYEDHPHRALYAALRMREEIRHYVDELRIAGEIDFHIRVGVNTGEAVVRTIHTQGAHAEYTPIGHATSLAARLQAIASEDGIVVSEAVERLCRGYFTFRALGATRIKGVSVPHQVFELVRPGPLRTRLQRAAGCGLTRFAGRTEELAAIGSALEQVKAGLGQVVSVVAEAGVGKSRLLHEFKTTAGQGCLIIEAFGVAHGRDSAYLPVVEALKEYFEIRPEDDAASRRERVRSRLVQLDPSFEQSLPYIFSLLGTAENPGLLRAMETRTRRRRTHEAIRQIVSTASLRQPVILIIEDLQWIDDETQALLDLLVESISGARILMLVDYRPEYHHGWADKPYYNALTLDRLGDADAETMLSALLSEMAGSPDHFALLKRFIIDRAQGNPFFMEETVQALFEQGVLVRDAGVRLAKSLESVRIPPTLQLILASRIDRLAPEEKDLLQTLAVIGREFSRSLATRVASKPVEELDRLLAELRRAEFIYEQPTSSDLRYFFKHALTQEVAYGSLLSERRAKLHERVGNAIEECFAGSLEDHLTDLAHHYSLSTNKQKAIHYLKLAGEHASQQSANREAVTFLRRALGVLNTLERGSQRDAAELDLQLAIGAPLMATRGFGAPDVESTYARALELIRRSPDPERRFQVLGGLWRISGVRGNLRHSREIAENLIEIAGDLGDPARIAAAEVAMGVSLNWSGYFVEARSTLERAILLDDSREMDFRLGAVDAQLEAGGQLALCLWFMGYPDQSLKVAARVGRLIDRKRDQLDRANALMLAMFLHQLRGDRHQTAVHATQAIAIASQIGLPHIRAVASAWLAWSEAVPGEAVKVLAEMRESAAAYESLGASAGRSWGCAVTAEILMRFGNPAAGLRLVAAGLAHAESADERIFEAELYRIRGELRLASKPQDLEEVEADFLRAIALAQSQNAKSWELRATTSLARLLSKRNQLDKGSRMLSAVLDWFTEGFDTADLIEAGALLQQLKR